MSEVRYTVTPHPLGLVLVAATERGVCAVALGDRMDELVDGVRRAHPSAVPVGGDDEPLRTWSGSVLSRLAGGASVEAPPLDVDGTAFQRCVWEELRRIPPGETLTYAEVARRIQRPSAARAVAGACAANPVAVLTPCHRVVRSDGKLGGYRWGAQRKRRLLALEKERPAG